MPACILLASSAGSSSASVNLTSEKKEEEGEPSTRNVVSLQGVASP